MNRLFPRLIFYFFVYCCYLHSAGQISKAESASHTQLQKSAAKHVVLNNYEDHKAHPDKKSKGLVLVPPPPPDTPSLLNWSGFTGLPESINFLSASDLKVKLQHLNKQIDNAKLQVQENNAHMTESNDKADRFNSLFTEGVVSRKELEAAQKDVADIKRENEEAKGNLADLKIEENAIIRRLNALKQSKEPHKRK